ncbi:MAG: hypothetical protein AAFN30_01540 [Actinomycetota bacterium]
MILAHGVGSRGDLPLPLWMFAWGSALAIVVSFVALGMLWTTPRLAEASQGRLLLPLRTDGQPLSWRDRLIGVAVTVGRVAGLGLFALSVWAGLFGQNDDSGNILPVTLYVIVWVGATLVNGLFGDLWRIVSPINTLALAGEAVAVRLRGGAARQPASPPGWLGNWGAAAGLFVFLFYELAHPSGSEPRTLAWMLVVHTVISLTLAARYGAQWIADNEPLAVLLTRLAAMGAFFRGRAGLRGRAPMSGLAVMPTPPGTLATLLVVLGGTTFDGFSESEAGRTLLGRPQGWGGAVTLTIGLVASILAISLFYLIGVWWTTRVTGIDWRTAADAFTPSLDPIVFGYAIAHYAQLLVDESQTFVFRLSDPAGLGWNLFGGADGQVDFNIVSVDLIAWIQVLAILFGHVGAVVVAHDRSIELFKAGESLRSQFAMLLVMVAYSTLGLWLLLNA